MNCAYIIESKRKQLYLAVFIDRAVLHYDGIDDETLLSNWDTRSGEYGDSMRFSPTSFFKPLRDSYPNNRAMPLVYYKKLEVRMPWFNKVEKLRPHLTSAMGSIRLGIQSDLDRYHRAAVAYSYADKFGEYYNGYEQIMKPVIDRRNMEYSPMDVFPYKIVVNPTQFVLYTVRLGDRPMMLKYKQYVQYMFAHNNARMYMDQSCCATPMYDPDDHRPHQLTSVGKYDPYINVLTYEAFEKIANNVAGNAKEMDEKEIKYVLEKISTDAAAVFDGRVEINKFPEHCQL